MVVDIIYKQTGNREEKPVCLSAVYAVPYSFKLNVMYLYSMTSAVSEYLLMNSQPLFVIRIGFS